MKGKFTMGLKHQKLKIISIELEIKDTTEQTQIGLLHKLTYTSKLTVRGG
jgi:hypothetical protein